jgi:hypothetical protein
MFLILSEMFFFLVNIQRFHRRESVLQRLTVLQKNCTVSYRISVQPVSIPYRTVSSEKLAYRTVPLPPRLCGIPSRKVPYREIFLDLLKLQSNLECIDEFVRKSLVLHTHSFHIVYHCISKEIIITDFFHPRH